MNIPNRKSIRLRNYDYSQNGYYFVTICTYHMIPLFGAIENGRMKLNAFGQIADQCWLDLPNHYENCRLNEYVIMPNHMHGIVVIVNVQNACANGVGNGFKPFPTKNHGLSEIIRGFKTFSSRRINEALRNDEINNVGNGFKPFPTKSFPSGKFQWQKSFYDHVIRNERSLHKIREYIQNNPLKWELDKYHPANQKEQDS